MKFLKITGVIVLILVAVLLGAVSYAKYALPNVEDAPDLKVEITPERLERGKYLANSVMGCMDCHAQRDFSRMHGPVIEASMGAGGEKWSRAMNFPGELVAPNITPYALKDWTDGEIYRAITVGVNKDGKALFPIMPYKNFAQLEDEDLYSVIAYLRTIKPVKMEHPERELDFPLSILVNTMPGEETEKMKRPDPSNKLAYGKYMLTAASCGDCHTPQVKGEYVEGMFMAGGMEFVMPNGTICRSANLTPHKETGIGTWNVEKFLSRFNDYRHDNYEARPVKEGEFTSIMPWEYFAKMKDEDLAAIFTYLQSLEPVEHKVELFEPIKLAAAE